MCGEKMRMSHGTVEWGSDDPSLVLGFDPCMLYPRVSGVSRQEVRSPGFARLALERFGGKRMSEGGSD